MEDQRFDGWIRSLGCFPSRRQVVGALAGGVLAAIGIDGWEETESRRRHGKGAGRRNVNRQDRGREEAQNHVAAQKGGKGKGKKKKKKQGGGGKPAPAKCKLDSDCGLCRRCRNGACETNPGEDGLECGECGVCNGGRCVPDPTQSGQQCSALSCKRCNASGLCGAPDDSLCQAGEVCRPADGRCAVPCLDNGAVCPPDHVCIDDGVFGDPRRCCNVRRGPGQAPTNFPCGDNGDGTHAGCCSGLTERCCEDFLGKRCIPKDECCVGETKCGNTCCPSGEECVNGQCRTCAPALRAADGSCCANGQPPCDGQCCAAGETCCQGSCHQTDTGECTMDGWCDFDHACCGTDGCENSACCRDDEICCGYTVGLEFIATCCPHAANVGLMCAGPGFCCPLGWNWLPETETCCKYEKPSCTEPVPRFPGRG